MLCKTWKKKKENRSLCARITAAFHDIVSKIKYFRDMPEKTGPASKLKHKEKKNNVRIMSTFWKQKIENIPKTRANSEKKPPSLSDLATSKYPSTVLGITMRVDQRDLNNWSKMLLNIRQQGISLSTVHNIIKRVTESGEIPAHVQQNQKPTLKSVILFRENFWVMDKINFPSQN